MNSDSLCNLYLFGLLLFVSLYFYLSFMKMVSYNFPFICASKYVMIVCLDNTIMFTSGVPVISVLNINDVSLKIILLSTTVTLFLFYFLFPM